MSNDATTHCQDHPSGVDGMDPALSSNRMIVVHLGSYRGQCEIKGGVHFARSKLHATLIWWNVFLILP
jgi:hypothetical protein